MYALQVTSLRYNFKSTLFLCVCFYLFHHKTTVVCEKLHHIPGFHHISFCLCNLCYMNYNVFSCKYPLSMNTAETPIVEQKSLRSLAHEKVVLPASKGKMGRVAHLCLGKRGVIALHININSSPGQCASVG